MDGRGSSDDSPAGNAAVAAAAGWAGCAGCCWITDLSSEGAGCEVAAVGCRLAGASGVVGRGIGTWSRGR